MVFLSADGGGTKLRVLLYDENLSPVGEGLGGGTNANFRSREDIRSDMQSAVAEALAGRDLPISEADFIIVGPKDEFENVIRHHSPDAVCRIVPEGLGCLLAGTLESQGILVLSGTGSDIFCYQSNPQHCFTYGGWGSVLGDEGSGYDIGVHALRAAIYAEDGRGEDTMILPLLKDAWKLEKLWDMVTPFYSAKDQRRLVASVTPLCAQAARAGDPVAIGIFNYAAHELVKPTLMALRRCGSSFEGSVCTAGGGWKGYDGMFTQFAKEVQEEFPGVKVVRPLFDPCMAGVIAGGQRLGWPKAEIYARLKKNYPQYTLHDKEMFL